MFTESIAASLIANGISKSFEYPANILYNKVSEQNSILKRFNEIFLDALVEELNQLDTSKKLYQDDLTGILSTANNYEQISTIPDADLIISTVVDGVDIVIDEEYSENELEELVNEAYEEAIERFIDELIKTDLADEFIITKLIELDDSVASVENNIDQIQTPEASTETYRLLEIDSRDLDTSQVFTETQNNTELAYITRDEIPELIEDNWILLVGRKGLGKTRSLEHLTEKIVDDYDIKHVVIPRPSFRTPRDVESLINEGLDGDVLLIWDDLQDLGVEDLESILRNIVFKLDDYLGSEGHQLYILAAMQSEIIPDLNGFEPDISKLWSDFNRIELEPLNEEQVEELLFEFSKRKNVVIKNSLFEKLIEKIIVSDPSPLYTESVWAELTNISNPTVSDIENIQPSVGGVWESLYSDLRKKHPDARFVLWSISLLRMGGIPPYKTTLRKLYSDLFDRDQYEFERSLQVLLEKQWITESDRPRAGTSETIYEVHDLQISVVNEYTEDVELIQQFSTLLLGPLEDTIPDADTDWIPHYHSNLALFFSLDIIEDTENLASPHFERAISLDPLNPLFRLNHGEILTSKGKYQAALEQFEFALLTAPEWPELRHSYAFTLDRLGRNLEAVSEYREVLELDSFHLSARVNLAQQLIEMGIVTEAKNHLEEVIKLGYFADGVLNNFGILCLESGEIERAEQIYREGLEIDPSSDILRYNLSKLLFETQQFNEAKEVLDPLFEDYTIQISDIYLLMALILSELEEIDSAKLYLDRYRKETGDDVDDSVFTSADFGQEYQDIPSSVGYADYLRNEGFYEKAKESYLEILDDGYETAEIYLDLAGICQELSEINEAREYFEKAVDLEPQNVDARMRYGNALKHWKDYDYAINQFEVALEFSDSLRLKNDYALSLMAAEKFDEAESVFVNTIENTPNQESELYRLHFNYGNLLRIQRDFIQAKKQYETALELESDYPECEVSLGSLLINSDLQRGTKLLKSGSSELISSNQVEDGLMGFFDAIKANEEAGNHELAIDLCDIALENLSEQHGTEIYSMRQALSKIRNQIRQNKGT